MLQVDWKLFKGTDLSSQNVKSLCFQQIFVAEPVIMIAVKALRSFYFLGTALNSLLYQFTKTHEVNALVPVLTDEETDAQTDAQRKN